jgi:hypothetical protein
MKGKPSLAPKTMELYEYLLAQLILPEMGHVPLNSITPDDDSAVAGTWDARTHVRYRRTLVALSC